MRVNGCTHKAFEQHKAKAWEIWEKRNEYTWTTDLGDYDSLIAKKK
jgi:hypothetical protein